MNNYYLYFIIERQSTYTDKHTVTNCARRNVDEPTKCQPSSLNHHHNHNDITTQHTLLLLSQLEVKQLRFRWHNVCYVLCHKRIGLHLRAKGLCDNCFRQFISRRFADAKITHALSYCRELALFLSILHLFLCTHLYYQISITTIIQTQIPHHYNINIILCNDNFHYLPSLFQWSWAICKRRGQSPQDCVIAIPFWMLQNTLALNTATVTTQTTRTHLVREHTARK